MESENEIVPESAIIINSTLFEKLRQHKHFKYDKL